MALATTSTPLGKTLGYNLTRMKHATNSPAFENKNVRGGPCKLFMLQADNMKNTTVTNTEVFAKLYDIIDDSLLGDGTSAPVFVTPVEQVVVPTTAPLRGAGYTSWICPEGFEFYEGISAMASQEDGDTLTTAPATNAELDLYFVTDK